VGGDRPLAGIKEQGMADNETKVHNFHDLRKLDDHGLLLYQAETTYRLLGKVDMIVDELGRQCKINREFYLRLETIEARVSLIEARCPECPEVQAVGL